MYLPAHFKGEWTRHAVPLLRADPFASLISCDDTGLPFVTHLPLQLQDEASGLEGESPVLLGHVARGNQHWRLLQQRPQAVVTFLGAHAYLSPQVYPDLARVPTWNYLAVHAYGTADVFTDAERLLGVVSALTDRHEGNGDSCENGFHKYSFHLKISDGFVRKIRTRCEVRRRVAAGELAAL